MQPALRVHQSKYLHSRVRRQVPAAVAYATADIRLPCKRTMPTLQVRPLGRNE